MTYSKKISNPHLSIEKTGKVVRFKVKTLVFYSKEYLLNELQNEKTMEVPAGAKIHIVKTIFRSTDNTYVSKTEKGLWFEWKSEDAELL